MLNDLFGIQSRGGCSCAGPYAQVIHNVTYNPILVVFSYKPHIKCNIITNQDFSIWAY